MKKDFVDIFNINHIEDSVFVVIADLTLGMLWPFVMIVYIITLFFRSLIKAISNKV